MKILVAVFTLAACHSEEKRKVGVTFDDVKHDTQKAVDSAGQAIDTTAAYVTQSKDDYLRALEHKLDQANADIERGKKRVDSKSKSDEKAALAELEKKRDELKSEIDAVKNGTADQWQEAKRKVQMTADALDAAVKTFQEKMR